MNYKEQLLTEHSRTNTDFIAQAIGNKPAELQKIIDIIYLQPAPLPQRASWLLSVVNSRHPQLLTPHIPLFIRTVHHFHIDGIRRNIMHVLAQHTIPEQQQATLLDICFHFLLSPTETVAVKVHAMKVIANLSRLHPEIKGELRSVIQQQLPKNTVAFAARARLILKKL